jgi:hypothetical protein
MPIEIKELHIRVVINTTPAGQAPASRPAGEGAVDQAGASAEAKEALVAECVEQVLQILRDKAER